MTELSIPASDGKDHPTWVRTRMNLDAEYREWVRGGFALVAAGFGSFAFLA